MVSEVMVLMAHHMWWLHFPNAPGFDHTYPIRVFNTAALVHPILTGLPVFAPRLMVIGL